MTIENHTASAPVSGAEDGADECEEARVDVGALKGYLARRLPTPPDEVSVVGFATGGSSNITAFLDVDGEQWVLRRPPLGPLRPSAHDMVREYKFVAALQASSVPVAETVLVCEDAEVLGAPFYLARRVPGIVLQAGIPAGFQDPVQVRHLAEQAIDALAAIHTVPWQELDVPYRPGNYLERQVRRWMGQLERTPTAARLAGLDRATEWIVQNRPEQYDSSIVHGDYGLHNMLIQPPPDVAVNAVLDWEMATIGDPLADLAWFVSGWASSQRGQGVANPANEITTWAGAPSSDELLARYAERTGRSMGNWRFYQAFTMWKGAIVSEALYSGYLAGTAVDPGLVRLETEVPSQVESLCTLIGVE